MTEATTLFLEPYSGLAGDMFLAALIALDDPRFGLGHLQAMADGLDLGEIRCTTQVAWRGSLSGLMLDVRTPEHGPAGTKIPHRGLSDCLAVVGRAPIGPGARARAGAVFRRIAEAEARVHGTSVEQIHFHEVGAIDALVDVCGAAHALELLGVRRVYSIPPTTGTGTVRCAHGEMPVPAPGTAEILRGLPMVIGGGGGERLTPTGAALLAEFVDEFAPPGAFESRRIGYAAGHRDPRDGPANILRVQLGRELQARRSGQAWLLEVNLDDMGGEELGHLKDLLRAADALDVWSTGVQMKKDRPGVVLSALCRAESRRPLEELVFRHSTTLGLRWTSVERTELEREVRSVEFLGRTVRVKLRHGAAAEGPLDMSPEHDDLALLSRATGRPLRELEREIVERLLAELRSGTRSGTRSDTGGDSGPAGGDSPS